MIEAEKRIREALADEALHDEGASVSDTLYAAHVFEEVCSPENIAALLAEIDRLTRERDEAQTECDALRDALKSLILGYVNLLENGRDRIVSLGGQCDSVDQMETGDPYLRAARTALAQIEQEKANGSR